MIAVKPQLSSSPREPMYPSSPVSPRASIRTSPRSPLTPSNLPMQDSTQTTTNYNSINESNGDSVPSSSEVTTESKPVSNSLPQTGKQPNSEWRDLMIQTSEEHLQHSNPDGDEYDEPQSVIHAPEGFGSFQPEESPAESPVSSTQKSDVTITYPIRKKPALSPVSPPPISTSIATPRDWTERDTPRAQTRQEIEDFRRKPHQRNLEDIPESSDIDQQSQDGNESELEQSEIRTITTATARAPHNESELTALRTALSECWTLCNTLASLSSIHRQRLFNIAGTYDTQEQAWKTCWKLCQKLYETRDDDHPSQIRPTLDLCREFCQALFEVRVKDNEIADSVLRVSFELNNHLYNTHDRNLPEAFRERTLDFYITLCHRLMKQRTRLAAETDSLLRACWGLAEMLFSLRQSKREGKTADDELLGSAVQACWELCDLFREGWTQIRPDRGTPRPSQTTFTQAFYQSKRSVYSTEPTPTEPLQHPETPTTIFDDTATVSPDQAVVPNIVVLGFEDRSNMSMQPRWPSGSSLSGYSHSSSQTGSSAHTVKSPAEDLSLTWLKTLIVRAAMNSGFQRGDSESLPSFIKALSSDAFGILPWQTLLLANYKKLVTTDPAFGVVPPPARASAVDIAQAVQSMIPHNVQYGWLRDLYRLVFGFHMEEAMNTNGVAIQT
ncbi:hypothetical protein FQN57_002186 [Myotisia sp. PD_48]|nr:hypothetical protein FQN57_002186 [Myotisia sp. PD_48]